MIQDDKYEFIGTWDDQFKGVGFESDFEGRPIERLIRCKDCKYRDWDIIDIPYGLTRHIEWCCFRFKENGEYIEVSPYDFCSKAERKEENDS